MTEQPELSVRDFFAFGNAAAAGTAALAHQAERRDDANAVDATDNDR